MPRTGAVQSQDFSLELDVQRSCRPGDVITGVIKLRPSVEIDVSTISPQLTFWGRSKAKVVTHTGSNRVMYRGRAVLFDKQQSLTELHEPDPDPAVKRSWRFTVIVPTSPEFKADAGKYGTKLGYLSNQEDTSNHSLPPAFYYSGKSGWSGNQLEAYVEYVLSATVNFRAQAPSNKDIKRTTTVPLIIQPRYSEISISDFAMSKQQQNMTLKTLKLLAEKQSTSLTFRERMRSTFNSSKIPQYSCFLSVQHPTIIQLSNPNFPFAFGVEPRDEEPWTSIQPQDYPSIQIISFQLKIKSTTQLRVPTLFIKETFDKSDEYPIYDSEKRPYGKDEVSLILPPGPGVSVDLGAHLRLAVQRTHSDVLSATAHPRSRDPSPPQYSAMSSSGPTSHPSPRLYRPSPSPVAFHKPLQPSFTSYNLAQSHKLHWKIGLLVVGTDETKTVEGSAPITVLGESEMDLAAKDREFDGRGIKKSRDDIKAVGEFGMYAVQQVAGALG